MAASFTLGSVFEEVAKKRGSSSQMRIE